MDAVDLDVWIEAQQPPIYHEIIEYRQSERPGLQGSGGESGFSEGMRAQTIRETAFALAAQSALAWRYEKLLAFTKSQEGTLDRIANFAPFVADDHMLLPSVTETRDRYELSPDRSKLRSVDIQYVIDQPARAVTEVPTWRDYIWREFPMPEKPDKVLFPRNSEEVAIWESAIENGWESGLEQAHLIWENNLNEMVRAIRGRITFRVLETRDIVQMPMMTATEPTITESGENVLNAGDVVYRVAVPVSFESPDRWKPLWVSLDSVTSTPTFVSSEPDLFDQDPNLPDFEVVPHE